MKFFPSFKSQKKHKKNALLVAGLIVSLLLIGWSSKAYSPAHIGHYTIPIPSLISSPQPDSPTPPAESVKNQAKTSSPVVNTMSTPLNFTHTGIITTFFWVGEKASADNGNIANSASAWDEHWQEHFGGEDTPGQRSGYNPAGFTPKENPFYFALPYNDITDSGARKASAKSCPLYESMKNQPYPWCKNSWIVIQHSGKTAYAQWEDVGPFQEDDYSYVFGSTPPKNKQDAKAGLDVSPAVRDYLGLQDIDKIDWSFTTQANVPDGPWKKIVTTSLGEHV